MRNHILVHGNFSLNTNSGWGAVRKCVSVGETLCSQPIIRSSKAKEVPGYKATLVVQIEMKIYYFFGGRSPYRPRILAKLEVVAAGTKALACRVVTACK